VSCELIIKSDAGVACSQTLSFSRPSILGATEVRTAEVFLISVDGID